MLLIFKERVCTLGTDFTDITFLSKYKQAAAYCFQYFQKGCVRFGTDFTDIAVRRSKKMGYILLSQFSEEACPFRHGLHGHCLLKGKKTGVYRSQGTEFTEFGLASNI